MQTRTLRVLGCASGAFSLILITLAVFAAVSDMTVHPNLFTVLFVAGATLGHLAVFLLVAGAVLSAVINSDERCIDMYLRGSKDAMERLSAAPPDNVRRIG
ncbi:hypothetical protein [Micromonospora peucetia]|uniref:Uncharacterized protein n=1 Tax=Micromonospora peucetia TaxID=47871 RepID=A0ABZ1EJY5_9ACTN|nr:hypothetical protein [Micromonospora peucetia]WSA34582.1 hypothetical protein OIE14_11310 [Micromonospora peucetia]